MNKFRFRKFQVYKDAIEFERKIKVLTNNKFPKEEQFCLTSQIWRAAYSVVLNIAEGADRGTDKDFAHFLNNSHTSLNEIVACLDLALVNNYIENKIHSVYIVEAVRLANQITAFRRKLILNPSK